MALFNRLPYTINHEDAHSRTERAINMAWQ